MGSAPKGTASEYNSRVWLEAIAQVPDVLLPEFMERDEEIVSAAGSERGKGLGNMCLGL